MSITYCHNCNKNIDEDIDVEHFENCLEESKEETCSEKGNQMNNIREDIEKILYKNGVATKMTVVSNVPELMYTQEVNTPLLDELETYINKVSGKQVKRTHGFWGKYGNSWRDILVVPNGDTVRVFLDGSLPDEVRTYVIYEEDVDSNLQSIKEKP